MPAAQYHCSKERQRGILRHAGAARRPDDSLVNAHRPRRVRNATSDRDRRSRVRLRRAMIAAVGEDRRKSSRGRRRTSAVWRCEGEGCSCAGVSGASPPRPVLPRQVPARRSQRSAPPKASTGRCLRRRVVTRQPATVRAPREGTAEQHLRSATPRGYAREQLAPSVARAVLSRRARDNGPPTFDARSYSAQQQCSRGWQGEGAVGWREVGLGRSLVSGGEAIAQPLDIANGRGRVEITEGRGRANATCDR